MTEYTLTDLDGVGRFVGTISPAPGGSQPGTPRVVGPYPVDFTDFAGAAYLDPLTLFVPTVGDHVIGFWLDPNTAVEFDADSSGLNIGQNLVFESPVNGWISGGTGIGPGQNTRFPGGGPPGTLVNQGRWQSPVYADVPWDQPQIVFATADPVVAQWDPAGPPVSPPANGHWDVYFMLVTPVAP